ncbi:hypothetical protein THAOC_31228, partial [Thalassiosira oceanica]
HEFGGFGQNSVCGLRRGEMTASDSVPVALPLPGEEKDGAGNARPHPPDSPSRRSHLIRRPIPVRLTRHRGQGAGERRRPILVAPREPCRAFPVRAVQSAPSDPLHKGGAILPHNGSGPFSSSKRPDPDLSVARVCPDPDICPL